MKHPFQIWLTMPFAYNQSFLIGNWPKGGKRKSKYCTCCVAWIIIIGSLIVVHVYAHNVYYLNLIIRKRFACSWVLRSLDHFALLLFVDARTIWPFLGEQLVSCMLYQLPQVQLFWVCCRIYISFWCILSRIWLIYTERVRILTLHCILTCYNGKLKLMFSYLQGQWSASSMESSSSMILYAWVCLNAHTPSGQKSGSQWQMLKKVQEVTLVYGFSSSVKGEKSIFAAHGNEALVQNGLLKFFFCCWGKFLLCFFFFPQRFVINQFIMYNVG